MEQNGIPILLTDSTVELTMINQRHSTNPLLLLLMTSSSEPHELSHDQLTINNQTVETLSHVL